jgi:hypothetical protein
MTWRLGTLIDLQDRGMSAHSCVYRKPKPGNSGDEARQGSGVNLWFQSCVYREPKLERNGDEVRQEWGAI